MYFELRFSIQREVYLRAKHDLLYEGINANPSTKVPSTSVDEMQTYKKELHSLRETNCNLERETYRYINTLPDGPLGRMLYAHEQQKDWNAHAPGGAVDGNADAARSRELISIRSIRAIALQCAYAAKTQGGILWKLRDMRMTR
ncbi:hypothetical protein AtubIFM56815_004155 [Aspergillus tubingensis]|uniref:Uncharacterized protein n=1 Tax=Aspergillus tubingensis TaxID=5068 RepID=A0A9W6EPQ9_ASPTU|nr:hypothetical protein AtubIFM56815_004155 [Aspergillus tubingensis]